ncbi:MAG: hypothetical protein EXS16_04265 [Gemmataceae bacterium]|nr:hypothetical protein [Gemmataceae bacterium]
MMMRKAQQVFKEALELPPESKADLVEALLNSLIDDEQASQKEFDEAWANELKDRFDAYRQGEITAYPLEDVISELRQRHAI